MYYNGFEINHDKVDYEIIYTLRKIWDEMGENKTVDEYLKKRRELFIKMIDNDCSKKIDFKYLSRITQNPEQILISYDTNTQGLKEFIKPYEMVSKLQEICNISSDDLWNMQNIFKICYGVPLERKFAYYEIVFTCMRLWERLKETKKESIYNLKRDKLFELYEEYSKLIEEKIDFEFLEKITFYAPLLGIWKYETVGLEWEALNDEKLEGFYKIFYNFLKAI